MAFDNNFNLMKQAMIKNKMIKKNDTEDKTISKPLEKVSRFTAEGNLGDILSVMDSIKKIIDVSMVGNKLEFVVDDPNKEATLPSISWELVSRELSDKTPFGAKKTNNIKEEVAGKLTGDSFDIYNTFFDCLVEISFNTNTKTESLEIQEKFEEVIDMYKGYLRKIGLSNIYFVKAISSREVRKYNRYALGSVVYYMEIQRIKSIRLSSIKSIGVLIEESINKDNPSINKMLDELSIDNKIL